MNRFGESMAERSVGCRTRDEHYRILLDEAEEEYVDADRCGDDEARLYALGLIDHIHEEYHSGEWW